MLKAEVQQLTRQIAKLNKMLFGPTADHNPKKSENNEDAKPTGAPQGSSETDTPSPEKKSKPRNRSGRGKREWPAHLERREIPVCDKDATCPCGCGGGIVDYERSETLEIIPAKYYVAVRQYPKFRCRVRNTIIGTRYEPKVLPKRTFSHSVVAEAIYMRFGCYLPWYRQEGMLEAEGIDLVRSTIMRWVYEIAIEAFSPIYELMDRELKENSTRLYMDETPLPELDPGNGKTRTMYMYALLRDDSSFGGNLPPVVMYYPRPTRARYHVHEILNGVTAIVQSDAYTGYAELGKPGTPVAGITSVYCWSHARRYFTDEHTFSQTPDAQVVVDVIDELYDLEVGIRGKPPPVREAFRRKYSVPVLERLETMLMQMGDHHLSGSGMGKAIRYVLNHWKKLTRFVENGRIELDTNAVERMFKPTILLRKNVLFIGSEEGAQAWGILSSIVETCKLNRVKVQPYLKWVMDQIARKLPRAEYDKLLPWNAPQEFRLP